MTIQFPPKVGSRPKISKKELISRIQSKVKEDNKSLISQALLSRIFDTVFDVVAEVLAEGSEVTTKIGVFKLKTIPDTVRRDIGNNTTLPVPGYYRPKLSLNNRVRLEFMARKHTFLPSKTETTEQPKI